MNKEKGYESQSKNSPRILVIQHFSPNVGDSSVICSMLHSLKKHFPMAHFVVSASDPARTAETHAVDTIPWVINLTRMREKAVPVKLLIFAQEVFFGFFMLFAARIENQRKIFPWFSREKQKVFLEYQNADIVICPGGHFFTTLNRLNGLIAHWMAVYLSVILKRPTVIYGQTIGPFSGMLSCCYEKITAMILNRVDLITVREALSKDYLDAIGVKTPLIEVTAEAAHLMPPPKKEHIFNLLQKAQIFRPPGKQLCGVTIHHIYYSQYFREDEYINLMATTFDYLIEKHECEVIFIPMEMCSTHGGDRPMARKIINNMNNKKYARVLEGEYSPQETMGVIGYMDLFVGTKTHSIIFALNMCVPTFCIAYHSKSREFMRHFGIEDYTLDLGSYKIEDAYDILDRLCLNVGDIKKTILQNFAAQKVKADNNNILILELLKEKKQ